MARLGWWRFWRRRKSRGTALHVEPLEKRCLMATAPLVLGAVYIEDDTGADHAGDTFEVSFVGGAAGTTLEQLVIDGDQEQDGLGRGDSIFDTTRGGLGADEASAFQIVSLQTADPTARVSAQVVDGTSRLVLSFERFQAGDKLVFQIDVDEIELWDPDETDPAVASEGLDPVTSGLEFHGSILTASFSAPWYEDASGETIFRNRYDALLEGTQLPLTPDDDGGRRDRTAGGVLRLQQRVRPAEVSGTVYHDRNLNGRREPGEEGLAGVPIRLVPVDTVEPQAVLETVTDAEGHYAFVDVMPGSYEIVEVVQPAGYRDGLESVGTVNGTPSGAIAPGGDRFVSVFLPGGSAGVDYDFGEYLPVRIDGWVQWARRGETCDDQDSTTRLQGVWVRLYDAEGREVAAVQTGEDGTFRFDDLEPGEYRIVEETPPEFFDGDDAPGQVFGNGTTALDGNDAVMVRLGSGASLEDVVFCERSPASLEGYVYHDRNNDGEQQADREEPIAGVRIELVDEDGQVRVATTDAEGRFRFDRLPAGTYRLVERQPLGWLDGRESLGRVDGALQGDIGSDTFTSIVLDWGSRGVDYGFGELLPGAIAGHVYADPDGDCRGDHEGPPIAGVVIELLDKNGTVIQTTQTDAEGRYRFEGLLPGRYAVRELQPEGWLQGETHVGNGGGVLADTDVVELIDVASGEEWNDYDFCEVPPATISGYVYQDGEEITTVDGRPPRDLASVRDGRRTPDDTPIEGVVLELRHGLTGEVVTADWALPGLYPDGPIQVRTNAEGYYEFPGLPPGLYAVYEVHPAKFVDGIDHPGTTSGVAINPNDPASLSIAALLAVDPKDDAIVRIALPAGAHSRENNFSEVLVRRQLVLPPLPLPQRPPIVVTPAVVAPLPPLAVLPLVGRRPGNYDFDPSHASMTYTWHLSIINGGTPRDDGRVDPSVAWQPTAWLSAEEWAAQAINDGEWVAVSTGVEASGSEELRLGRRGVIPIAGDFNGDGIDEIGFFDEGDWYLDLNGNGRWDDEDLWARLGGSGDLPVVGDWDGDGKDDIGVFGPEWRRDRQVIPHDPGVPDVANERRIVLSEQAGDLAKNVPPPTEVAAERARLMRCSRRGIPKAHVVDHVFAFGNAGAIPIAGDFNGDGISTIGTFHFGRWFLDGDGDGRRDAQDASFQFGQPGDLPVVGDFDGDGITEIGVYRGGVWIIDTNGNHRIDQGDQIIHLGGPDRLPVVADLDGDGVDDPMVYRPAH